MRVWQTKIDFPRNCANLKWTRTTMSQIARISKLPLSEKTTELLEAGRTREFEFMCVY